LEYSKISMLHIAPEQNLSTAKLHEVLKIVSTFNNTIYPIKNPLFSRESNQFI